MAQLPELEQRPPAESLLHALHDSLGEFRRIADSAVVAIRHDPRQTTRGFDDFQDIEASRGSLPACLGQLEGLARQRRDAKHSLDDSDRGLGGFGSTGT